jgi:hypothetical protein
MVEGPERQQISESRAPRGWALCAFALLVTSCVVYTPELLHEEAVSLGRPNGAASDSPAAPAPRSLQNQTALDSNQRWLAALGPLRAESMPAWPEDAALKDPALEDAVTEDAALEDAAAENGTTAEGRDAGAPALDAAVDAKL